MAHRSSWLALTGTLSGALLGACAGPSLSIDADGPCFVDGQRAAARTLPFRYYGTVQVEALPPDSRDGEPDWARLPVRAMVEVEPPASRWLFPFDLPVELVRRLWSGQGDQTVALPAQSTPDPVVLGFQPDGLERLRARAAQARAAR